MISRARSQDFKEKVKKHNKLQDNYSPGNSGEFKLFVSTCYIKPWIKRIMLKSHLLLAVAAFPLLVWPQSIFPTGTTIYDPDKAYSSYILLADHTAYGNHPDPNMREANDDPPGDIRLIDMNGNIIHTWQVKPYFNKRCRLLPNGNLVYVGPEKTIYEYDWDGNVVWTHQGIGSMNDMRILPNNNRLLIAHEPIPDELQKQVKDVELAPWWPLRKRGTEETQLGADIYEINLDGEIVWEWHAHHYIDVNLYSPATPEGDWLHGNSIAPLPENKWFDNGDERFRPGNILFNARNINTIFLIDKVSKMIVWEGTHTYKGGMAHSHEPEMIEKGLPGEGNIIFFDNGLFTRHRTHTGQSFIVELNPITHDIEWLYETNGYANLKFFSKTMGTQKRLPNGNTYIAEDNTGRLFQVTPDGEIVWEYVNRGGTTRPTVVHYDFTPQLRALEKPIELKVSPMNNLEWHIKPDKYRK
ncbi:MAG: arylsulfotransferase family protein [Saprospiraceae bacterium]|nr:arylsulfotransferase family protein [Saprospiraceae bacterium]